MNSINYSEKIPNNVNLAEDRTLQRALEGWQPNFINWWDDVGPEGSTDHEVYLRTAVSVDPSGWAQFGHVKMRDYRWGIFLNPGDANRQIHFGDHKGEKAWTDIPGEYRANLRFNGPENMFTRVFGRLTAWQNWIFQRPNAVGEKGALKVYGKGEKAAFDWHRV